MLVSAFLFALADTGVTAPAPAAACRPDTSKIPRVPVYVRVTVANRWDTSAAAGLLLIAEAVATHVRAALGAPADSVPRGDSLFVTSRRDSAGPDVWLGGISGAGLRVVARRDGTLRWSPMQQATSPVTALLDRALTEAKQGDETFIVPDAFTADSIPFTLDYHEEYGIEGGRVVARAGGPASLVAFTRRVAVEKQAASVPGTLRVAYPASARGSGSVSAAVQLSFVVDTSGRAVASTIHDIWPQDRPRLTGELGDYYREFVRAGTEGVLRGRFYPAEIGGCKVKQLVLLPVTFSMER